MKIKKIVILLIMSMCLWTSCVFAVEPEILIRGEETAKTGETKNLTISISSEKEIGIITGKIETNEYISNIAVTSKNNWSMQYNAETKLFNILKPEGAKSEEIINIEYTTGSTAGVGKIIISNIEINTIEYETTYIESLTKEIEITQEQIPPAKIELSSIKIVKSPIKVDYIEGEKFDATGMEVEATYSDGSTKIITNFKLETDKVLTKEDTKVRISYTEDGITKTAEQEISVVEAKSDNTENNTNAEDNTKLEGEIPKAGVAQYILISLIAIAIIAGIFYKNYIKNIDI